MDGDTLRIPDTYVDIVNDAIRKENFENFTLCVSNASGKGENYLGVLYRIRVTGTKDGRAAQLALVLKIPLQSSIVREKFPMDAVYIKEAFVYNVILPKLTALQDKFDIPESEKFHHVKCFAANSEKFREFLLLEDMGSKGFSMANRRESLSYEELELVLKTLASFHALSFAFKKLHPEEFRELGATANSLNALDDKFGAVLAAMKERALAVLEETLAPAVRALDVSHARLMSFLGAAPVEPYSVLCHGDCWNNNLLFKFKEGRAHAEDMVLLDWQLTRHCSPVVDISYLVFSSTDYGTRRRHLAALLEHYHASLARALRRLHCDVEQLYPERVFRQQLRDVLPYGLLMAFMLLPIVLGEEEDVPDFEAMAAKGDFDPADLKFENKQASDRYSLRMNGVVKTFQEMELI